MTLVQSKELLVNFLLNTKENIMMDAQKQIIINYGVQPKLIKLDNSYKIFGGIVMKHVQEMVGIFGHIFNFYR